VLEAMNIDTRLIESALRISFGYTTTEQDIDQFATVYSRIIENAKKRAA
jgi:cysteine sulfinate desulfinase/cysteine desulfurase-like protein